MDVVVHGGLRGILRGVSNRRSVGAARLSGNAGGVGAVEVGSEREHNAKLIPVKMAAPWID